VCNYLNCTIHNEGSVLYVVNNDDDDDDDDKTTTRLAQSANLFCKRFIVSKNTIFPVCFSPYGQVRTSDKMIEAAKTGNLNMVMFSRYKYNTSLLLFPVCFIIYLFIISTVRRDEPFSYA